MGKRLIPAILLKLESNEKKTSNKDQDGRIMSRDGNFFVEGSHSLAVMLEGEVIQLLPMGLGIRPPYRSQRDDSMSY